MTYTGLALTQAMERLAQQRLGRSDLQSVMWSVDSDTVVSVQLGRLRHKITGARLKRAADVQEVVFLCDAEIAAEVERWKLETGLCECCGGSGMQTDGWSAKDGLRWIRCRQCGGSGRAE